MIPELVYNYCGLFGIIVNTSLVPHMDRCLPVAPNQMAVIERSCGGDLHYMEL